MRVKDFYIMWLEEVKKPMLAYQSFYAYKICVYNYIIPLYGQLKMDELTKFHVRRIYIRTYEKSSGVARVIKTVLSSSLKYAKRNHYIVEDLVTGLKWNKGLDGEKETTQKNALETWAVIKMFQCAYETELYLPILLASLMGLRRGEIVGLKYSDVDFKNKQLSIQRQLGVLPESVKEEMPLKTYTKQEISLKTPCSKRKLKMPNIIFEALLEERVRYEKRRNRRKKEFQDLDFIYCSSYGRPRTSGYLSIKLREFITENELPYTNWRNLRYTYSTMVLGAGYDLQAISNTLGHTRKEFTADVYVDLSKIIKGYVLNTELLEEHLSIEPLDLPEEMEELLKEC
ncbi:MAG: site-specific integrase [Lachnospiraceae bacterium]|nr:site-specific integrase [Lachnospiraceae bacterium]